MMRLLRGNVAPDGVGRRGAYGERRITLLPGESAIKILFSPCGRFLLQVAKYSRNAMPFGFNEGSPLFGGEGDVIVQVEES